MGTHTITATYSGDTSFGGSNGSATEIVVGPFSLSQSIITVSPARIASGSTATVTLVARDANGNQELGGGLTVKFALGGTAHGKLSSVTDNKNGTYTAAFTGTTAGSNTVTATITIGGKKEKVTSAPPTITVVGPVSLSKSTIAVSPSQIATGGTTTVTLTAKDAKGNQELGGGLTVVFKASGSAGGTIGPVTDNKNGTYTATFAAGTKVGTETITATIGGKAVTAKCTVTVTSGGHGVAVQDAAIMAVLADAGKSTTVMGPKKRLSLSDLWLFGEG